MTRRSKVGTFILRVRLRVGCWIIGGRFWGVVMRYQLIAERARKAVSIDGRVTLAECQPLADALYAEVPGTWTLVLTEHNSPRDDSENVRLRKAFMLGASAVKAMPPDLIDTYDEYANAWTLYP